MRHRGPYQEIYNLPIGGEATARPKPGEPLDKALKRIKDRLAKYAAEDRYFRARADDGLIVVQRTREGHNTSIGDWLMMKPGDRLLLKTKPTPADVKRAKDQCDYVTGTRAWNKKKHLSGSDYLAVRSGVWGVLIDGQGRLVVECATDEDGNSYERSLGDAAPLRHLWTGEWP